MKRFVVAGLLTLQLCLSLPAFGQKTARDHLNQADDQRKKGNSGDAIHEYDAAIGLDPSLSDAYLGRGAALFEQRRWAEALPDFQKVCQLDPRRAERVRLLIWTTRVKMGEKDPATRELAAQVHDEIHKPGGRWQWSGDLLKGFDDAAEIFATGRAEPGQSELEEQPHYWLLATAMFLIGEMDERVFFKNDPPFIETGGATEHRGRGTQSSSAWYYAGLKRLMGGDKETAEQYFQKAARAPGRHNELEGEFAKGELKAMEKADNEQLKSE